MTEEADVHLLLSDLHQAAKGIDGVSQGGRALMLQRAAWMLGDLTGSDDGGSTSTAAQLKALAENVEDYPAGAVAAALMDAGDAIFKASMLLRVRPEGRA